MIAVTSPVYPERVYTRPCKLLVKENLKKKENKYETILAREVRNWFDHAQMIGVLHVNPICGEDFFDARVAFHKNGMTLKKYGDGILQQALADTKYEALIPLNKVQTFSTAFIISTEHKKVDNIVKILKKFPQMHLLCGVVENQLLSRNEFLEYSNMASIDVARSQLVNVLNMAAGQLVQNLSAHQSNLANILDAHVRENSKPTKEVKAADPEKQ